jgi:ABC-type branched-subunit amino acid transport system ATPase component
MEILRVENLSKSFDKFKAVNDVSFSLRELELTALIGPNGAGKTTLINLITKKLMPDSGRVFFMGKDITNLKPHQIVRLGNVGTFQIISMFPTLTVYENLKVCALTSGLATKEIDMIMLDLRLEKFRDVKILLRLPLGIQKLVELSMALALKPKLLLLDEPAAGLPHEDRKNLMRILKDIGKRVTLLIVEHDIEFVFELAQRIIVMDKGKIIADGKLEEIASNKLIREIYLGE